MKKKTINHTILELNQEELKNIKKVLQYAVHRLENHPHCGISEVVNLKLVKSLLNDIG